MKQVMKKTASFVLFVMLLLLASLAVSAEGYEELTIRIPIAFYEDEDLDRDCEVVISYDEEMPRPDSDTKILKKGQTDSVAITVAKPGVYTYQVYEQEGDDEEVIYDDTVYTITIYVINGEQEGSLTYTITASSSESGAKPESLEFYNTDAHPGKHGTPDKDQDTDITEDPDQDPKDKTKSTTKETTTTKTQKTTRTLTKSNGAKTSDNSPLTLYGALLLLAGLMILACLRRGRQNE